MKQVEYYIPTNNPNCYITVVDGSNDCRITHFNPFPTKGILYIYGMDKGNLLKYVKNGCYRKVSEEELALMI